MTYGNTGRMTHAIEVTMNRTILLSILIIVSMAQLAAGDDECTRIIQVRDAIRDAGANWTAGPTSVSGLTAVEQQRLSLSGPIPTPRNDPVAAPSGVQHDAAFDWRDKDGENWVTPVRSQGVCGSCWAFSAVGVVESAVRIYTEDPDKEIDLSEQHLVSECCSAGSCSGGWPDWALDYIRDTGVPDENCFPYAAKDSDCDPCPDWTTRVWKITGHTYVEPSESDFKYALQEYGPVSVVLSVPDDWYYYKAGIYEPVTDVRWANHAVVLVGWDDSDGCWIIKNGWGQGWGENGYARVKYGNLEKYNYAYAIEGIIDPGASPDPDVGRWLKPVSAAASSEHIDYYGALKAIDNRTDTHWFSDRHDETPHITFDLGELITINRVRMMVFYRDVPIMVDIAVSGDNTTWLTVESDFEIVDGSEYAEIMFSTSRCQYVRITETEMARSYGTVTEFDVFVHEEDNYHDMFITLHYIASPDLIMQIDAVGLLGMMLSRQNDTLCEWFNR